MSDLTPVTDEELARVEGGFGHPDGCFELPLKQLKDKKFNPPIKPTSDQSKLTHPV